MKNNTNEPYCFQIELTKGCNRNCEFCGIYSLKNKEKVFMNIELAWLIVKNLSCWITKKRIEFAMHGEPLLNKDVCKIIKIFRGELLNSQLMLTTNGDVLINETKLKLNKLFESGLNVLAIDCYGNYEKRRKLFNENKPNNIKFFDSNEFNIYYYHSIKTKCIVVFDSLPKLTKDMKKKIINCAGNSNEFFSNKYGYKIIEKPLEKKCSKPFREMVIKSNGNITFCCNDWKEELVLGNIKENLLENIWYSKKFIELRQRVFNKDRNFVPCNKCDYNGGFRIGLLKNPGLKNEKTI